MPIKWGDAGIDWDGSGLIWPFFSGNASDRSASLSEIHVTLHRAGRDPFDLTNSYSSLRWSTNAVGGFGSCTLTLPGQWRKEVLYLSLIRVTYGPEILFEGRVEDLGLTLSGGQLATNVEVFGLARILDDTSVRRIWSKRALPWRDFTGSAITAAARAQIGAQVGAYDPADLTKTGVRFQGQGDSFTSGNRRAVGVRLATGLTATRLLGTYAEAGTTGSFAGYLGSSADGASITDHSTTLAAGSFDQALVANAVLVLIGMQASATFTAGSSDTAEFTALRLLGTSLTEDASGGFYGGTILRDLIALCPDLTIGVIEDGSDFTIQSLERTVRSAIWDVLNEVAGYYSREWAIWEGGRFDWTTPNLDEPQYIVQLEDLASLNVKGTVDGVEKTTYILYTDAASGDQAEASVTATDRRNPYVAAGDVKDGLSSVGFPMTSNTSAQLAARVNSDRGKWAPVRGQMSIPIGKAVAHATGAQRPAFMLRAGDNVRIVGLPTTDPFQVGRDGETFFHISSCDVDLDQGLVMLALEGQSRSVDVLLARLAAATRNLIG